MNLIYFSYQDARNICSLRDAIWIKGENGLPSRLKVASIRFSNIPSGKFVGRDESGNWVGCTWNSPYDGNFVINKVDSDLSELISWLFQDESC
jgi:hypothetical protein